MKTYDKITTEAAEAAGLRPLTHPYFPQEYGMLDRVLQDMERGGIRHAVVEGPLGLEVWRGPKTK